jgi:hypothetical protein
VLRAQQAVQVGHLLAASVSLDIHGHDRRRFYATRDPAPPCAVRSAPHTRRPHLAGELLLLPCDGCASRLKSGRLSLQLPQRRQRRVSRRFLRLVRGDGLALRRAAPSAAQRGQGRQPAKKVQVVAKSKRCHRSSARSARRGRARACKLCRSSPEPRLRARSIAFAARVVDRLLLSLGKCARAARSPPNDALALTAEHKPPRA